MLQALFLILIVSGVSAQDIFRKQYTLRRPRSGAAMRWYTVVMTAAVLITFLVLGGFRLSWQPAVVPYALVFAVGYTAAVQCILIATKEGSLALTALVSSYSLIIPVFAGVFWLDEKLGLLRIAAIAMLAVSIYLLNRKTESTHISKKWLLAAAGVFVGNGTCSSALKMQQHMFVGQHRTEFLVYGMAVVLTLSLVIALLSKKEQGEKTGALLKDCLGLASATGGANGCVNVLASILGEWIPASLQYPLTSASTMAAGVIVARLLYKEKLDRLQQLGFFMAVASIVLLNL
ncbi:MAG: hypothetical protein IKD06_00590 [Clostridia bacterium]|nr:hypothetical protein [Clostridia bacterium]